MSALMAPERSGLILCKSHCNSVQRGSKKAADAPSAAAQLEKKNAAIALVARAAKRAEEDWQHASQKLRGIEAALTKLVTMLQLPCWVAGCALASRVLNAGSRSLDIRRSANFRARHRRAEI